MLNHVSRTIWASFKISILGLTAVPDGRDMCSREAQCHVVVITLQVVQVLISFLTMQPD